MVQRRTFRSVPYASTVPFDNESYEALKQQFIEFANTWDRMRVACSPGMIVRGMRKAMGMSQRDMAIALDIEQGTLSKYESGTSIVPVALIDHVVSMLVEHVRNHD
ncbi:helix-turn-helix domain-containing protein [Alicyclobacillus fastidiosus]|uniref:Helix-turn-helix transcriptional regulator n=1 Tax=Alicyclobacillus fastidiosus TaxID=392011 RepID=A0ABV5AIP5_9BACL|nr:helix-turn-helix transcriptional regulator [Alicyclobacillus fastidiosus]WEH09175.1 helix-turn-helix transcriptional regulator [Alicyclobacillus fastidiosus]